MNEEELILETAFPKDYSPPPETDWDRWANTVDIKLSRQGIMILGLGAAVLVVGGLTVMQGKVTIKLVKGHGEVAEALNQVILRLGGGPSNGSPSSVTRPTGKVTTEADPIDEELQQQLRIVMDDTKTEGLDFTEGE
jgi:hypothetical protein